MSFYRAPTSIHPGAPIHLTTANLTRITNAVDARKEDRVKYGNEYRALANLLRPDSGPSVVRYERPAEKATLDVNWPKVVANTDTGGNPDAEAQRRDDIERVARGEPLVERPDIRTQMSNVARKAAATEVVIERLEEEFRTEFTKLSAAHCKTLKPAHDEQMKKFFKLFGEAYGVYSELRKTRQDLMDSQMAFSGLFGIDLDFLRGEEVQSMFNAAKAANYVTSVPKWIQA